MNWEKFWIEGELAWMDPKGTTSMSTQLHIKASLKSVHDCLNQEDEFWKFFWSHETKLELLRHFWVKIGGDWHAAKRSRLESNLDFCPKSSTCEVHALPSHEHRSISHSSTWRREDNALRLFCRFRQREPCSTTWRHEARGLCWHFKRQCEEICCQSGFRSLLELWVIHWSSYKNLHYQMGSNLKNSPHSSLFSYFEFSFKCELLML